MCYNINMDILIKTIFVIVICFKKCFGVIYQLNDTEYAKLPPIFVLDPYEPCMTDPEGLYCITDFVPIADQPNELLDVIMEYSAHTTTHFNYSLLRYGICVPHRCNTFERDEDLRLNLEACLNETFYKDYGLKTKVINEIGCKASNERISLELADILLFVILVLILLMNVVGSLYDVYCMKQKSGLKFLIYFSIRRNWRKLLAPAADGPEPRLKKLKSLAGIKVMSTMLVIMAHTAVSAMFFIDNPRTVEGFYKNLGIHLFFNGPVFVQTFFIMSGFLLIYNLMLFTEKRPVSWKIFPIAIILRYIRLTPPYALLLFFEVTWMRFISSGAGWQVAVTAEVEDCRKYWWQHLLYINNYNDVSNCMAHSWYLAADTQLYCLGLLVFITCRSNRSRKLVLSLLLVLGLIIPPSLTYFMDLDGIIIVSPETINHFFITDPTYNNLYKRGYTDVFNYAVGLSIGYLVYYGQQNNVDLEKYKKYRLFYWLLVPLSVVLLLTGSVLYRDGPRHSMLVRMLFAALMKPAYGVMLAVGMVGAVFQYESVYRYIAELGIWTVPGRLSYCTFLLHVTVLRILLGMHTVTTHVSIMSMLQLAAFTVVFTYLISIPYWILVEQPFSQLIKLIRPDEEPAPQGNSSGSVVEDHRVRKKYNIEQSGV